MKNSSLLNWFYLSLLVIFWGSTFALTKYALVDFSPLWIVAIRLAIGFIIIFSILKFKGEKLPRGYINWLWLFLIGMTAFIPFFLICWGTIYLDTSIGGILFGIGPLFTIIAAHFLVQNEKLNLIKFFGVVFGFIGLYTLLSEDLSAVNDSTYHNLFPQIAILLAAIGYSIQNIAVNIMPNISLMQKTSGSFLIGSSFAIGIALFAEGAPSIVILDISFISVLIMGIFSTAMASIVMFNLTKIAGPTFVSLTHYVLPIYVVLVGTLFLKETLQFSQVLGMVIIIFGIIVTRFGSRQKNS
ncbi:MAG: DMT family transporter [Hyphomicrobiales bacterium]|mgnify:FL=1|jgi:drug/metabolite transporter (DMT)-like permease|nr:DMT family transporter [Hyphomicrobiales bacterium]